MARKKNPAIKATGATSSKAAPLPDWVKGNAPKPSPSYTKAAKETASPPPAPSKPSSNKATIWSTTPAASASQAVQTDRTPPLFPSGVKPPISVLNERIQKHHAPAGWLRAAIEPRKASAATPSPTLSAALAEYQDQQQQHQPISEGAWSAVVILTKTNKADASKPLVVRLEPKNEGESMVQWTTGERGKDMAKQLGAVYALFRICSNLSLNRVLPQGGPREYWNALEAYKAKAPTHQEWMWAAEPFEAAAKRVAETAARAQKREKESEARKRGEPTKTGGKRWEEAREVRMSAKLRERTEACVRQALQMYPEAASAQDNETSTPNAAQISSEMEATPKSLIDDASLSGLVSKLTRLGFRAGHARIAARWVLQARTGVSSSTAAEQALKSGLASLSDEQAALEYLVLFTPEEDLPQAFAPSESSDSFVTSSTSKDTTQALAVRWGAERLAKLAGFPNKAVVKAFMELEQAAIAMEVREGAALDMLLCRLLGDEAGATSVLENAALRADDAEAAEELSRKRDDERLALGAVLGEERVFNIPDAELSLSARQHVEQAYDVRISAASDKEDVRLRVTPGSASRYPTEGGVTSLPTFYVASSTLPAYLRLALTAHLVRAARSQPDWLEMLDAGQGGVALAMAEELETCWKNLVDNPPDLASIMFGLVPVPAPRQNITSSETPQKSPRKVEVHREPRALRRDATLDAKLKEVVEGLHHSKTYAPMRDTRAALPAAAAKEDILKMLRENRVVIIAGETGCGKTTQVPQFILDDAIARGEGSMCNIIVTQPRRVSAMGVASRVADERCEKIGQGLVGYAIKGERKASRDCRLQFSTTGVLLRRLATGDTQLAGLSHIIVDEVHERSVDSDFLLLELRQVLQRNPTLRLVLMSATIDQQTFSRYFNGAPGLEIPGRTFPVQDIYLEDLVPQISYRPSSQRSFAGGAPGKHKMDKQVAALRTSLEAMGLSEVDMQTVQSITSTDRIDYDLIGATVRFICEKEGEELQQGGAAILVFVPGVGEIKQAMDSIRSAVLGRSRNVDIIPLHANLSPEDQRRVFVPSRSGTRKIVVSTNVAEASITIPEVSYVIDSGRVKETRFEPESGLTRLVECWASRASCRQRRGRAGRTRAGQCFKLFTRVTESDYMVSQQTPEMQRVPLEALFLQAKAMRDKVDVRQYLGKALSPPSLASMDKALDILQEVGAIHPGGFDSRLTALGRHLSNLPLDLRLGKMLILGSLFGCLAPMLSCAAIMSCKPLFLAPYEQREEASKARAAFAVGHSDLLTDAAAFAAWARLRAQQASNAEIRDFCEKNFFSHSSLRDIQSTRSELLSQLEQLGFVSRSYNASGIFGKGLVDALDAHASDINLQKSLIVAGLWPSVIRIALPPAKFDQAASGTVLRETVPKEVKYFDNDGRIFVHPSSVLFNPRSSYTSSYLAVFKKSAAGEGSKRYLRDGTEAPLYALLLFGGQLQIHHMIGGVSIGRASAQQSDLDVRLRSNARIGVLCGQLRRLLDAIMAEAFESPADGAMLQADGQATDVIDCMRALVANDGFD